MPDPTIFDTRVEVNGAEDATQLKVKGHTTQSQPLQEWQDNSGSAMAKLTGDGRLQVGDPTLGTENALVEASEAVTLPSSRPKRGLQALGSVTGAITEAITWVFHELKLLGSGGVSGLHAALRARISNSNTGDVTDAQLRAGAFEAVNEAGSSETAHAGALTALHASVDNAADAYLDKATGVEISLHKDATGAINEAYGLRVEDVNQAAENYAIHTGAGPVHLGDYLEIAETTEPDNAPAGFLRLFADPVTGHLKQKDEAGNIFDLTEGFGGGSDNPISTTKETVQTKTLLGEVVLSTTANDITFSNLPGPSEYDYFVIEGEVRSTEATLSWDALKMLVNGDTDMLSYQRSVYYAGTNHTYDHNNDDAAISHTPIATSEAGRFARLQGRLYQGSNLYPAARFNNAWFGTSTSGDIETWQWERLNSEDISSLQFVLYNGELEIGSWMRIYGVKEQGVVTDVGLEGVPLSVTKKSSETKTLIEKIELTIDGKITFSNLPASSEYDSWFVEGELRGSSIDTWDVARLYANNDLTNSNYTRIYWWAGSSTAQGSDNQEPSVGGITGGGNAANHYGRIIGNIYPDSAHVLPYGLFDNEAFRDNSGNNNILAKYSWQYNLGGPLTTLEFQASHNNGILAAGSWVAIYGVKKEEVVTDVAGNLAVAELASTKETVKLVKGLADIVLAADASAIEITDIPNGIGRFDFSLRGQSDYAGNEHVVMYLNGDETDTNYRYTRWIRDDASDVNNEESDTTDIGYMLGSSNDPDHKDIIGTITQISGQKTIIESVNRIWDTSAGDIQGWHRFIVVWKNTTGDISSIKLLPRSGTVFKAGTHFTLEALVDQDIVTDVSGNLLSVSGTVNPASAAGRISLSSTEPLPASDISAATSLHLLPYGGNLLPLWNGTAWENVTIPDAGVDLPLSGLAGDTMYDVFAYLNNGAIALEAVSWTSSTVRAIDVVRHHGIWTKSSDLTRRLVGSLLTDPVGGSASDTRKLRNMCSWLNTRARLLAHDHSGDSTYAGTTPRPWDGDANSFVSVVQSINEHPISLHATRFLRLSANVAAYVGIGLDTTAAHAADCLPAQLGDPLPVDEIELLMHPSFEGHSGIGAHQLYGLEWTSGLTVSFGSSVTGREARYRGQAWL